jgi:glycosyltransferase involved in cell wall biosynthesis
MIRICKTKKSNVTVFTTKEIFSRLKTYLDNIEEYSFVIKKENESINHFLKHVEKICNEKIDLLFINTIQTSCMDLPHYFRFKPKTKMILTVHTTNHWLKAKYAFNPKNILRSIDATISLFFIRKIVLPKFNAINVIYPPTKNYIQKNTNYKKPVFTIPFNFFDENKKITHNKKDDVLHVVVPGKIEEYRRDYDTTLDVFEKLYEKYSGKIILYLLGKPMGRYGERIIQRCKKLKQKGYNISFPAGFVSDEDYKNTLIQSDVIFSPLKVKKIADAGMDETYGTSEGSAIPFEGIQNSKPLILPKEFKMIKELESSTIQYDSAEDLENKLSELINDREKLSKIKKEAEKNSNYFSLKVLHEYFIGEILEKIDNL